MSLPSKRYFNKTTISPSDELGKDRVLEKGKIRLVNPIDSELNGAWKNRETRAVLIQLFNGKRDFNFLMNEFVSARYAEAKEHAETKEKELEEPFPFGDRKQIFLKNMMSLKALGLVKEVSSGMLFKDASTEYTLTENGGNFVKRNLIETIKDENFEFFIILLGKEDASLKVHHLLMKLIERKKLGVDQIILLIRHDQPCGIRKVLEDYVSYLVSAEGEDEKSIDEDSVNDAVLEKISSLIRLKYVVTDKKTGEYSISGEGQEWINKFTESMDRFVEFLKKTGMIEIKKKDKDFFLFLTEIGKEIGNEIERVFQTDENRILDRAKSVLNDVDDHETTAPLPIHHIILAKSKIEKDLVGTIYLQPDVNKPLIVRIRESAPALVVSMASLFGTMAVVGLAIMPRSPQMGGIMAGVGFIGAFLFASLYMPSIDIPKRPQYVNAKREKKRYLEFLRRTEKKGT